MAKQDKQLDCRINLKSLETEYLITLISRDNLGLQVVRAGLMKKLLVVQSRQQQESSNDYSELFIEGEKLKPVQAIMQTSPTEQRAEELMKLAMTGQGTRITSEDEVWYKETFGWDLL